MSKKVSDQGWFYHVPPRPVQKDRVCPPPVSQIPGLVDETQLPPDATHERVWLRESDSDYVRLAKQGGRPGLLVMQPPEPPSSKPVGYPICKWYYDSVPSTDDCPREPYKFTLPDYMVSIPANENKLQATTNPGQGARTGEQVMSGAVPEAPEGGQQQKPTIKTSSTTSLAGNNRKTPVNKKNRTPCRK